MPIQIGIHPAKPCPLNLRENFASFVPSCRWVPFPPFAPFPPLYLLPSVGLPLGPDLLDPVAVHAHVAVADAGGGADVDLAVAHLEFDVIDEL